jgi:hypothetical protein
MKPPTSEKPDLPGIASLRPEWPSASGDWIFYRLFGGFEKTQQR